MPGQCYGCGAEFSLFKKERGCKNCGFAFCNKCLNEKAVPVPKRGNAKHHVCFKCYKILTGAAAPTTGQEKYDLPEAYLKRMAALKEREASGSTSSSYSSSSHSHPGGQKIPAHLQRLDKEDRDIAMRLEKLKEGDKPKEKVTDKDLNARLAQLKGQPCTPDKKPEYRPPDRRPEAQQVDDLIEQLSQEVELDSLMPSPAQEVEARLAQLRQREAKPSEPSGEPSVKPNIDSVNIDQKDVDGKNGNNLNKVNKMESISRPYSQNIGQEPSAGGDQDIDIEEMQRLMAEAAKELELDGQRAMEGMQKDKELMERLREVQKRKVEKKISNDPAAVDSNLDNTPQSYASQLSMPDTDDNDNDEENDEEAAKKIIQRYLEEVKIDRAVGDSNSSPQASRTTAPDPDHNVKKTKQKMKTKDGKKGLEPANLKPPTKEDLVDSDYDDSDELPYCCICTEDATIRCRDCDMDLYCQKCFRQCHAEMDITDHRTSRYKAPKGYR